MDTNHSDRDDREAFKAYLKYFETLRPETVDNLAALVSDDFHFCDPFNNIRGAEKAQKTFRHMFRLLKNPQFRILETAYEDRILFTRWDFTFSTPLLAWGKPQCITGFSRVTLDDSGKISSHWDYWDASTAIYMRIPVIRWPLLLIRKFLS
ncbi:MAG: nuclear transport factor 2 family protein [Bdellovibrionales bacterium]|nr:nuclear transport factor 2 family protein [Bdellovibrionales bacterium]